MHTFYVRTINNIYYIYNIHFVIYNTYILCLWVARWVPSCECAHSWRLYSLAQLGNQVEGTITQYPTQVRLSWLCADMSLSYPINVEYQAR